MMSEDTKVNIALAVAVTGFVVEMGILIYKLFLAQKYIAKSMATMMEMADNAKAMLALMFVFLMFR